MSVNDVNLNKLWEEVKLRIRTEPEEPKPNFCVLAQQFHYWFEDMFQDLIYSQEDERIRYTREDIHLAMHYLQEKYHEERIDAPPAHKDFCGSEDHVCIYSVYVRAYSKLRWLVRNIDPPAIGRNEKREIVQRQVIHLPSSFEVDGTMAGFIDG